MRIIFSLFMIIFLFASAIVAIVYFVSRAISSFSLNPQGAAWKRMVERLRNRAKNQKAGPLVPWDHEMLGLLSLNRSVLKKPGFFDNTTEGVFTTIFHEPVLAYVTLKGGANNVTLARTSDREFIYRQKGRETEIWLNGQPFGVFVDGALLSAERGSKLLAQVEAGNDALQMPVLIGNGTAASISRTGRAAGPNPRALTLLRDLGPAEENALLALTILEMTR